MIWKGYGSQHRSLSVSRITRTKQAFRSVFLIFICLTSLAFILQNINVSSSDYPENDNEFLLDAGHHRDGEVDNQFYRGYNSHSQRRKSQEYSFHYFFDCIGDDLNYRLLNHISGLLHQRNCCLLDCLPS